MFESDDSAKAYFKFQSTIEELKTMKKTKLLLYDTSKVAITTFQDKLRSPLDIFATDRMSR